MKCSTCAAGEEDVCGNCKRKVRDIDNGIKCDGCRKWHHTGCEGVGRNYYRALKDENGAVWFCKKCKQTILSSFGEIRKLREENKQMMKEMQNITSKNEDINES